MLNQKHHCNSLCFQDASDAEQAMSHCDGFSNDEECRSRDGGLLRAVRSGLRSHRCQVQVYTVSLRRHVKYRAGR